MRLQHVVSVPWISLEAIVPSWRIFRFGADKTHMYSGYGSSKRASLVKVGCYASVVMSQEECHETTIYLSSQHQILNDGFLESMVQSINDSLVQIKTELEKIPTLTVAAIDESFEDRTHDVLSKLDALPEKIIGPVGEIIDLSKREVLAELVRISSRYSAHDSHDSGGAQRQPEKPIHEITKGLTGKQKSLLAILLDTGFLSYAEIGEKLGITHESAKNLVNRLIKDMDKGRLFSKQQTDQGIKVGVSSDVQDEVLKRKYRTIPNDSD